MEYDMKSIWYVQGHYIPDTYRDAFPATTRNTNKTQRKTKRDDNAGEKILPRDDIALSSERGLRQVKKRVVYRTVVKQPDRSGRYLGTTNKLLSHIARLRAKQEGRMLANRPDLPFWVELVE